VLAVDDAAPRREVVVYLNRLSDLLFALARRTNAVAGVPDVPWKPR
jgi:cob(I)alamin adenosyltransferase